MAHTYQSPPTPPLRPSEPFGPPLKPKRRWPAILAVVAALAVAAIVLAFVIGGRDDVQTFEGPNGPATSVEPSAVATSEVEGDPPYVEEESESEPDPTPVEPQRVNIGKGAAVEDLETGGTATILLEKVTKGKCQYQSIGCDKPENGQVYQFHMLMKVNAGKGSVSINPYMFYFETPDGERYEYDNGASSDYGAAETLDSSTVRPGRQVKGVIKFDGPKSLKGSYLVLTAGSFNDEVLAEWKL